MVDTEEDARQEIETISENHGYVSEEVWAKMDPDVRKTMRRAFDNKDRIIASSVST
jgi:hypothetical protein